jgi:hypothetical protein
VSCPRCGARNPRDASWCTQCFDRLDGVRIEHPPAPGATSDRLPSTTDLPTTDLPASTTEAPDPASSARSGDVRVTGELVEWRCRRCDGWNALELAGCVACGAPREGFATQPSTPTARAGVQTARIASVVLPGLGHLLQGAVGSGVARMVLFALWLGGGVALIGDAPTGGAVLLLGASVLWAATLSDVGRVASGERELLGARGLGALVAVVTVLLVLGAALRVVAG